MTASLSKSARLPVLPAANDPGPGLFSDARGPREPGFIPVWQLNYDSWPERALRHPSDLPDDVAGRQDAGRAAVSTAGHRVCVSGRTLVKRPDGTYRIDPYTQVQPADRVLPNHLRPCTVSVRDDGIYEFRETTRSTKLLCLLSWRPARE